MKRARYYVGASFGCLLAGLTLLQDANGRGTAEDVAKAAEGGVGANVSIGTVVMWWGSRDAVPAGWEICNGELPTTTNAILTGKKPNLVDRFPKGALSTRKTIADLNQATGGNHNMPALRIGKIDGLKIVEDGAHSHAPLAQQPAATDEIDQADNKDASNIVLARGKASGKKPAATLDDDDATEGKHSHDIKGFVGSENGINADGDDKTGANQPAYSELFFIIRVK